MGSVLFQWDKRSYFGQLKSAGYMGLRNYGNSDWRLFPLLTHKNLV